MTIYIGVDQSLAAPGIAVVRDRVVLHSSCTITAPSKLKKSKASDDKTRVDSFVRDFVTAYRIAKSMAWEGEEIRLAVEAPAGSQSAVSAKCMGLAYGAALGACYALGVNPSVITARDAKTLLAHTSVASKKQMVDAATRVFGRSWHLEQVTMKRRTARQKQGVADALALAFVAGELRYEVKAPKKTRAKRAA